jgi:hypothetical protein
VLELTEHEQVRDIERLLHATEAVRGAGVGIALDDFGDGRSSLRLWSELKPDLVKIDKYFARHIATHGDKLQTLRALMNIAEVFGTTMVAEGLETVEDLKVVRDLGVALGQGFLLGRPAELPVSHPAPALHDEVGLINREHFLGLYTKPFFREIYGRQPCTLYANTTPLKVDLHAGVEELTAILTSGDQRYLTDGFILTEDGCYRGIGTGEQLVRAVTELRIEAARHANPLTFLPGNIPITDHITRLLDAGGEFVACYGDLKRCASARCACGRPCSVRPMR